VATCTTRIADVPASFLFGQLAGEGILDATLSGFVGAARDGPGRHLVARAPGAPPSHVMILPAFWLLVPGAIG
jgi:hypothetical protein